MIAAQVTAGLIRILPKGAIALARAVSPGDADQLWPEERADLGPAVPHVLAESGAARAAARDLMRSIGQPLTALRRGASRAAVWPPGLVGSLTHTKTMAAAALAKKSSFAGLGIDLEPPTGLDRALAKLVLTKSEVEHIGDDPLSAHLWFSVKEAVFKAVHPIDGVFLDFRDVELDVSKGIAHTCYGRTVSWAAERIPMLIAVAWIYPEGRVEVAADSSCRPK